MSLDYRDRLVSDLYDELEAVKAERDDSREAKGRACRLLIVCGRTKFR